MQSLLYLYTVSLICYSLFSLGIYYNKPVYYFILEHILTPILRVNNAYFIENFYIVREDFFHGNVRIEHPLHGINIDRNAKNQYSLLNQYLNPEIIDKLRNNEMNDEIMKIIFNQLKSHIHLHNDTIQYDDFIFVDMLTRKGNYFPGFHTDIGWSTFCNHHGFQLWILLDEDEKWKPKGKMYILETPYVKPANSLVFKKKGIEIQDNHRKNFLFSDALYHFDNLSQLNPSIQYLDAGIGQIFLMNPSIYHCSDPDILYSTRRAFNIRAIYNPQNHLTFCNYNNGYTELLKLKFNLSCDSNHCSVFKPNSEIRFLFA